MLIEEKEKNDNKLKLLELTVKSIKSSDNNLMQRYFFELLEIEKFPISLTDMIIDIFCENYENKFFTLNEIDQKCFLIYIKNWFNKLKELNESKKIKYLQEKFFIVMKTLFDDRTCDKNKFLFEEILRNILILLQKNTEFMSKCKEGEKDAKLNNLTNEIVENLKSQLASDFNNGKMSLSKFYSYLILVESISYFKCGIIKHTHEMNENLLVYNIILNIYLHDSSGETENKIIFLTRLTSSFCKISIKLLETFKKEEYTRKISSSPNENFNYDSKPYFFNSENFLIFVDKILKINSELKQNNDIQLASTLIIVNPKEISSPEYGINNSKSNIVEMLTIILQYLTDLNLFENFELIKNYSKSLCMSITKALGEFCSTFRNCSEANIFIEKTDNSENEITVLKYLTRMMEFLTLSVQNSSGSDLFNENKVEILRYVILPLILITPLERDLFLVDAEEYLRHVSDMSAKQNTRLPKHKTINLIDMMCEYVDSFLKLAIEFFTDLIYYVIIKNNSSQNKLNTSDFSVLENMKIFHDFLNGLSDENLLDMSLQVLSSISYLIYDKEKLKILFEEKIEKVNDLLIQIQSEFVKSKLCNFYAYTLDDLFHNKHTILSKCFDDSFLFLFSNLINPNSCISLNFMALEAIQSLVLDEEIKDVVVDVVKLNIKNVLNLINIPNFKELTNNIIFHKFVKNILSSFYKEIEGSILDVFNYFWVEIKIELGNLIQKNNQINREVLKEKNFKLLENMHNLRSLVENLRDKSNLIESKSLVYNELLGLLNYLSNFLNYDYEEDILGILSIILDDLKLVPNIYKNCLNTLIDSLMVDYKLKIENYHITFIFTFLKNLRREDYLPYKKKFFWNDLEFETHEIGNKKNYIGEISEILILISQRFETQPISDDFLIENLCFIFFLLIIKLEILGHLNDLKHYPKLEILLIKFLSLHNNFESVVENSIASIFSSKMIMFLFTQFYNIVKNYSDDFEDKTIINTIKHLINFNIIQLQSLRIKSSNHEKSEKIYSEFKNKKGKLSQNLKMGKNINESDEYSEQEEEDENSDLGEFHNKFIEKHKRNRIKSNIENSSDEEIDKKSQGGSEYSDERDDEFLKVVKPKKELSNLIKNFAPKNFHLEFSTTNEYKLFDDVLQYISATNVDVYLHLISTLTKSKQNSLDCLRKFKKILTDEFARFRKIVKIKRK